MLPLTTTRRSKVFGSANDRRCIAATDYASRDCVQCQCSSNHGRAGSAELRKLGNSRQQYSAHLPARLSLQQRCQEHTTREVQVAVGNCLGDCGDMGERESSHEYRPMDPLLRRSGDKHFTPKHGRLGDGMFFSGVYDVQFQSPKAGGLGFVQSAKITCSLNVSRN